MRTKLLLILAMAFTLSLAGTALAQDNPTQDAYGGVLGDEVSNQADTSSPAEESTTVATQESTGSLPFTGLELGLVALAGLGLVALGVAMRRTTRSDRS